MTNKQQNIEILRQNTSTIKPFDFLNISFSNNNYPIASKIEEYKKIKNGNEIAGIVTLNPVQNSLNMSNYLNKALPNFSIDKQKINETNFNIKKIPNSMNIQNQNSNFIISDSTEIFPLKESNSKKSIKIKVTRISNENNENKKINENLKNKFNTSENKIENNINKNVGDSRYKELIKKIAMQLKKKTRQPTRNFINNEFLIVDQYMTYIKKISSKLTLHKKKAKSQGLLINEFKIVKNEQYKKLIKKIACQLKRRVRFPKECKIIKIYEPYILLLKGIDKPNNSNENKNQINNNDNNNNNSNDHDINDTKKNVEYLTEVNGNILKQQEANIIKNYNKNDINNEKNINTDNLLYIDNINCINNKIKNNNNINFSQNKKLFEQNVSIITTSSQNNSKNNNNNSKDIYKKEPKIIPIIINNAVKTPIDTNFFKNVKNQEINSNIFEIKENNIQNKTMNYFKLNQQIQINEKGNRQFDSIINNAIKIYNNSKIYNKSEKNSKIKKISSLMLKDPEIIIKAFKTEKKEIAKFKIEKENEKENRKEENNENNLKVICYSLNTFQDVINNNHIINLNDLSIRDVNFIKNFDLFLKQNNIDISSNIPIVLDNKSIYFLKESEFWLKLLSFLFIKKQNITFYTIIILIEQYYIWAEDKTKENKEDIKLYITNYIQKNFLEKDINQFLKMSKLESISDFFIKYETLNSNNTNYKEAKIEKCLCELCIDENAFVKKFIEINKNLINPIKTEEIEFLSEISNLKKEEKENEIKRNIINERNENNKLIDNDNIFIKGISPAKEEKKLSFSNSKTMISGNNNFGIFKKEEINKYYIKINKENEVKDRKESDKKNKNEKKSISFEKTDKNNVKEIFIVERDSSKEKQKNKKSRKNNRKNTKKNKQMKEEKDEIFEELLLSLKKNDEEDPEIEMIRLIEKSKKDDKKKNKCKTKIIEKEKEGKDGKEEFEENIEEDKKGKKKKSQDKYKKEKKSDNIEKEDEEKETTIAEDETTNYNINKKADKKKRKNPNNCKKKKH